jgi:hypothetical protein
MRPFASTTLLARTLAIVALPLLAGCGSVLDSCGVGDTWETVTSAVVRDDAGTPLAQARVTLTELPGLHDDEYSGSLRIEMTGPPSPTPSGGPLAGWVDAVRLEDAEGVVLVQAHVERDFAPNTFHVVGASIDDPVRLRAVRTALRGGRAVLQIEMIDDPQSPIRGPVRATLPVVAVNRFEGLCT